MTDTNGCLVVLDLRVLLIRLEGVQNELGLPTLQAFFLRFHPFLDRILGRGDGLGGGAEVIADMEEIQKIASVLAKPFFHLVGNPACAVSDGMQLAIVAKARPAYGVEENSSGVRRIAFERAAIRQGLREARPIWRISSIGRISDASASPSSPCSSATARSLPSSRSRISGLTFSLFSSSLSSIRLGNCVLLSRQLSNNDTTAHQFESRPID